MLYGFLLFHINTTMPVAVTVWLLLPVIVSAYFGGLGPGLVAAAIQVLYGNARMPVLSRATPYERWAVYWIVAISICLLNEFLHRARRRAEATDALRLATLASIGEAVVATDADGRITFVNSVAEQLSGWQRAASLRQPFEKVFEIVDEAQALAKSWGGKPLRIDDTVRNFSESYLRHRSGALIPIEASVAPIRFPDGSLRGVVLTLRDVTERKRAEHELRSSQLQLQAALDAGQMGIMKIDLESGAVVLDESACKLWGVTGEPTAADTWSALLKTIHPEDQPAFEREYQAALQHKEEFQFEMRVLHAANSMRWLALRGRIERTSTGQARQVISLIADITFNRKDEETRTRSQKLEALGVLAGGIAHDFNNLLLAITGNIKLAKLDLPEAHPAQESLREITKASARSITLVRQILNFSQPQERKREVLELQPVLDEALGLARTILPASVSVQVKIPASLPKVVADAGQIHQVIINLLTNAAAAINTGGRVEVSADTALVDDTSCVDASELPAGQYVRIMVTDDGVGMDPATVQRIFDPFFTTKPIGQGTGLGLAIVHGIMKSNGGAITVRSALGNGATFTAYFPVGEAKPIEDRAPKAANSSTRSAHILYVDDEESLVFLMTRTLQRLAHQVQGFTNPQAALDAVRANPHAFDLVVSDLSMPGMSGFDLAQAMLAIRENLPIVITSGYFRPQDYEMARQIGVRELILKPNTIEALGELLSQWVDGQLVADHR